MVHGLQLESILSLAIIVLHFLPKNPSLIFYASPPP
jgi:hypothetical protein